MPIPAVGVRVRFAPSRGVSAGIDLNVGLVGYWPMNEGAGPTAFDATSGDTDLTAAGGPVWGTDFITFNGAGSLTATTISPTLRLKNHFTTAIWCRLADPPPVAQYVWTMRSTVDIRDNYANLYGITLPDPPGAQTGKYEFWHEETPCCSDGNALTTTTTGTGWHHIAWTYDRITLRGYRDGVQDYSSVTTLFAGGQTEFSQNANSFRVGGNPSGFLGDLKKLRIYNRALSAAEILEVYNA